MPTATPRIIQRRQWITLNAYFLRHPEERAPLAPLGGAYLVAKNVREDR